MIDDKLAEIRARHEFETPLLERRGDIGFGWWQELHSDRATLLAMVDELRAALQEIAQVCYTPFTDAVGHHEVRKLTQEALNK